MNTKIVPLLGNYQEKPVSQGTYTSLALQDEITFAGKIYKSILLDLKGQAGVNPLTKCTKVRDETTDDE